MLLEAPRDLRPHAHLELQSQKASTEVLYKIFKIILKVLLRFLCQAESVMALARY